MKNISAFLGIVVFILTAMVEEATGQGNPLNRPVDLWLDDVKLGKAMSETERVAHFYFSYKSGLIRTDSVVDLHSRQQPVRRVLRGWFRDRITWKAVNNHIILLPGRSTAKTIEKPAARFGRITDTHTGKPLPDVTIFAVADNRAALSDSSGGFTLESGRCDSVTSFYISRQGYSDTIVGLQCGETILPDISLRRLPDAADTALLVPAVDGTQIEDRGLIRFFIPKRMLTSSANLRLFETRLFQVSFLPWLSSEPLLTGSVAANFSLNIIAGYNGAVNGIEVGGVLNAVRHDVHGIQVAGYINIVGNRVTGLQSAGFVNLNLGRTEGIQLAGFSNITLDSLKGIQIAGFVNTLKGQMKGMQAAGFMNVTTRDVDGLQVAGFANYSRMRVNTAQLAGFGNYCQAVDGVQVAGFINVATNEVNTAQIAGGINTCGEASGVQLAGLMNVASGRMTGVQVASMLNVASKLTGVQLALFNVCDSVPKGVPIGLLSVVAHGMHRLELASDLVMPLQLRFKTGVPAFYNQVGLGFRFKNTLEVSYGLGSRVARFNRLALHLDLTAGYLWSQTDGKGLGRLGRAMLTLHYRLWPQVELYLGPQINMLATRHEEETHPDAILPANTTNEFYSGDFRFRIWPGIGLGLSLF
ncbi:MAG: hypothetical protein PHQ65_02695 [Bacteroidales bacterium]|nr:hypothetical protein [Bacteroidales bacterium]MDD3664147.1 hypothetical protein [Bacteroidales bacterium]